MWAVLRTPLPGFTRALAASQAKRRSRCADLSGEGPRVMALERGPCVVARVPGIRWGLSSGEA